MVSLPSTSSSQLDLFALEAWNRQIGCELSLITLTLRFFPSPQRALAGVLAATTKTAAIAMLNTKEEARIFSQKNSTLTLQSLNNHVKPGCRKTT
jgi:hypothetical protein